MYDILLSKEAKKQLKKLDKTIQKSVVTALKIGREDPIISTIQLTGVPFRRLRVGDYRVIIQVIKNKMIIHVIKIKHRKNVYDF